MKCRSCVNCLLIWAEQETLDPWSTLHLLKPHTLTQMGTTRTVLACHPMHAKTSVAVGATLDATYVLVQCADSSETSGHNTLPPSAFFANIFFARPFGVYPRGPDGVNKWRDGGCVRAHCESCTRLRTVARGQWLAPMVKELRVTSSWIRTGRGSKVEW